MIDRNYKGEKNMLEKMGNYYRLYQKLNDVRELSEEVEKIKTENREVDSDTLREIADNIPATYEQCNEFIKISKHDLANRIKRRKSIIILVLIWPILALVAGLITKFITGEESWMFLLTFLYSAFIIGTYSLCWVGFPIGWNKTRELSGGSDSPTILVVAFFVGLFTMCFSYIIAIVKIFTEKKDIDYVKFIIEELNRTITRTQSIEKFVSERLAD